MTGSRRACTASPASLRPGLPAAVRPNTTCWSIRRSSTVTASPSPRSPTPSARPTSSARPEWCRRITSYLTTVTGLLKSKEQIEDLVVDVVKGAPVYVKNLARVTLAERPVYTIVTADGLPAVLVNVHEQPDGNAVEIADAVNNELQQIRKTLPPDVQLNVFYDQSINVRDSIGSVTESILIGLGLSILVVIGFL